MAQILIIHAPADETIAERVAAALLEADHTPVSISQPESASNCALAIAVWTDESCRNEAVIDAALAATSNGFLISIDFDEVATPHELAEPPPVSLTGWTGAGNDPRWRFVLSEIEFAIRCNPSIAGDIGASEARQAGEVPPSAIVSDADWPPESEQDMGHLDAPHQESEAPLYVNEIENTTHTAYEVQRASAVNIRPLHAVLGAGTGLFVLTAGAMLLAPSFVSQKTPQIAQSQEVQLEQTESQIAAAEIEDAESTVAAVSDALGAEDASVQSSPGDENSAASTEVAATEPAPSDIAETPAAPAELALLEEQDETPIEEATTQDINAQEPDLGDDTALADAPPTSQPASQEELPRIEIVEAEAAEATEAETESADALGELVASVATEITPATAVIPDADAINDGNYFRDCTACPAMASLPPGQFSMGSPATEPARQATEGPVVDVTFAKGFAMSAREVTFAEWEACVADGGCRGYAPYDSGWGRNDRPVIGVSFEDAQSFAAWLSAKTGTQYRIPSEAEWEYAARAGADTAFAFGRVISTDQANFNGEHAYGVEGGVNRGQTTPTASFAANAFGLYDMHGNVWEWTSDCWTENHEESAALGAVSQGACDRRVLRGGAWNTGGWRLRSAHRIAKGQTAREYDNGFRVVRDLD